MADTTTAAAVPLAATDRFAALRALRVHQWVKNVLVLVPVILDHRLSDVPTLTRGVAAFLAFCLAASGGYILNDLLDVHADRAHPTKRQRPFASGALAPGFGWVLAPLLLADALLLGAMLGSRQFLGLLLLYLVTTTAYSVYLKQIAVLDVLLMVMPESELT